MADETTGPEEGPWSDVASTLSMLHQAQIAMVPDLVLLRVEVSAPNDEDGLLPCQRLQIGLNAEVARQIGRQLVRMADMLEGKGTVQ